MKKLITFAMAIALTLGLSVTAMGQAFHDVTVEVNSISEVAWNSAGDDIILTIDSFITPVTDSTQSIEWFTNENNMNITVETDLAAPAHTLRVTATGVSGGAAAGTVTLSAPGAQNFVTGISTTSGGCTLQYSAITTPAAGTTPETHTVTYTITS
jgi:hypothetical protein